VNQKGLAPILIILLIAGVIGGYFVYKNVTEKTHTQEQVENPSKQTVSKIIELSKIWEMGTQTYTNTRLDFTLEYPKILNVSSSEDKYLRITFSTPDVSMGSYQQPGFDYNSYDENAMRVIITKFPNENNLSLDEVLADIYKGMGIDGKTQVIDTLRKDLKKTDFPIPGSLMHIGVLGESPSKRIYFSYKETVYEISLFGGNGTGQGYTKDAENIFDQMIESIKLTN
jgi:hypothetical protein